ncbi:MAG: matrixin family metalloprotease [Polyangiaceae bacterium]
MVASRRRRRVKRAAGLALAVALGVALAPSVAHAYCFTTTCKDVDACDGEEIPGCATLRWDSGCTGFSVQENGGSGLSADTTNEIARLAFDAWREVDCGGGEHPGIVVTDLGQVSCDVVEYNKDAGNANIILFNHEWPYTDATHTYALTTTTFDPDTGELLNADIELNSRDHDFTVNDESIQADLLSVLTHESGHFLGLAHSGSDEATMFAFYQDGTTDLRSLSPDDVTAICTRYPPRSDLDDTCNPLPRHGFSPYCRDDQPEGDCSVSDLGRATNPPSASLLVLLGVAAAIRAGAYRRRSAGRAPSRDR